MLVGLEGQKVGEVTQTFVTTEASSWQGDGCVTHSLLLQESQTLTSWRGALQTQGRDAPGREGLWPSLSEAVPSPDLSVFPRPQAGSGSGRHETWILVVVSPPLHGWASGEKGRDGLACGQELPCVMGLDPKWASGRI